MELPPSPDALPIPVVDTHCHLDIEDGDLYLNPAQALARATSVGVDRIVQVGVDVVSSRWGVELAAKTDGILATVAIHPNEAPRIYAEHGQSALDVALAEIIRGRGVHFDPAVADACLSVFNEQKYTFPD